MKKKLLFLGLFSTLFLATFAQFTVTTVPPLAGGNGSQGVTFGLTSAQTIVIDTIFCTFTTAGNTDIWVTTTDLTGPPTITAANGWTNLGTANIAAATVAGSVVPIPLNLGYTVLPGVSYRFFINGNIGAGMAYTTGTAGVAAPFSDGIVTIETGNLVGYGGPAPNPANHPRQFNGSVRYSILGGTNDAAVASIDAPGVYCSGAQPVIATIANYGANQIDSVDVVWEVNGVVQGTVRSTTLLDTLNGAGSTTTQVTLGNFTFPQGLNDLRVWTSMPNGVLDTSNFNDTAAVKTGPALNGTFTINAGLPASSTNYTSFTSLSTALNTFGICGPVTVNVAAGTYNESFELNNINGSSSTNTITIDGADSTTTILTHNNTSNYGTVTISGTDYVTIRNMRIEATANNGAAILLNNSSYNTFESNVLWANPNSTSTNTNFIISGTTTSISTNGVGSYNTVQNNLMIGGYYSVYMYGSTTTTNVGNTIHNNQMDSVYYYGGYIFYQDSLEFTNNEIDQATRGQINGDGLFLYYSSNFDVSGNYIHAYDYGIYFYNFSNAGTPTLNGRNRVVNNMVVSESDWGMYFLYTDQVDLFYNSVATYGTVNPAVQITMNTTNIIDDYDVRNNIFYSNTTEALELVGTPDTIFDKLDNNVYYSGGTNLFNINAAPYTTLAAYQTAQPAFNGSSLSGDPQFISTTDLHIIGSFVNGAGDNSVPVTVDIDGQTRPLAGSTTVDPGADEFNPPLCPPSVNLGATNITLTTADIFWTGVTMDYQYEVVPAGAAQGSGTAVRTALDTVNVTGLTPSSSYDFYVREICGRGDTSIWIGPFTFNTSNGIPYFEDFETFPRGIAGNPWPRGWTSTTSANPNWISTVGTGANNSSTGTGPFVDHTLGGATGGTYIYMETSGGTVGATADFVSPPVFIDPTITTFTASYWYFMFGAQVDSMEVFILSNGVYTKLTSYVGQQQTAQTDPWLEGSHSVTGFAGQSVQLVFRGSNPPCCAGDIGIDDVRIFEPSPEDGAVTDILSPTSGCGLGSSDSVRVEISNLGTSFIANFPVAYTLNGGAPVVETYVDTIFPGAAANFTFNTTVNLSTLGTYTLVSYTNVLTDGDRTNDTSDVIINNIPLVGSFPYLEDFETSNGGWTAYGVASTWAWGTPAGAVISSAAGGTGAWVTNLTGSYNNSEASFIESPCLDLSSLTVDPILSFSLTYDTESCCDEGWVEYSTDGGATWTKLINNGGALQWYNDLGNQWWDGTSSGGAGVWVNAENVLVGLAGQSSVKIRFAFSSDGSVIREGFGIDNVRIDLPSAIDAGVSSLISPVTGCGLSGSDSVRVRVKNFGADTLTSTPVSFELNGAAAVTETITTIIVPGDSLDYTFTTSLVNLSVPGNYNFKVYTGAVGDGNPTNDTLREIVASIPIGTFPYTEDFETSNGGWTTSGAASTWAWGTPAGSVIASAAGGTGAWVTNLTGAYNNSEFSYLESPCFDLSGQTSDPVLRFSLTYETESCCDEGWVEVSTDGGVTWNKSIDLGAAQNWYNDLGNQWWDGNNASGAGIWDTTSNVLTGTAGFSSVKFRFAFSSDGSVVREGFGVDNVSLDVLTSVENINDAVAIQFSLYPNPTDGLVTLKFDSPKQENYNMRIMNVQGQMVYEQNVSVKGAYSKQIDLSDFSKGIYYLHLQTETGSRVEKLIIQ